jgi:hypothetical protein
MGEKPCVGSMAEKIQHAAVAVVKADANRLLLPKSLMMIVTTGAAANVQRFDCAARNALQSRLFSLSVRTRLSPGKRSCRFTQISRDND